MRASSPTTSANRIGVRPQPTSVALPASGRRGRAPLRGWLVLLLALGLTFVAGCATPQPVFGPVDAGLVWPADGAPERIRYVGQLRSAADLHPQLPLRQRFVRLLVGSGRTPSLHGPRDVIATSEGRLWVADPGGSCVHALDVERRTYQRIEQVGEGHLLAPVGVAFGPGGSILVCDSEAGAVYRLDATSGRFLGALAAPEVLHRPVAAAYDASSGAVYVVDSTTHDVKVFGADGGLRRVIGRRGTGPGELNFPVDIACSGAVVWVVDAGNGRVQAFTPAGAPLASLGQPGDAPGDLALPKSVAVDSEGHLYVVDARFENIQIFDSNGQLLLAFGGEGKGPGQFALPGGISIDANDRIWVCDTYNGRIQVFQYMKAGVSNGTP